LKERVVGGERRKIGKEKVERRRRRVNGEGNDEGWQCEGNRVLRGSDEWNREAVGTLYRSNVEG
jgi:hypothetical protein